jgi:atypical dual specificity phosphatase
MFLRKLRAKVDDRPTGFVWVKDRVLAGSGYPASRAQVAWIAKSGIGSILSLTDEPLPGQWTEGFGLNVGHVPMKDHQPPDLDSMDRSVRFIEGQEQEGKAVLVHCLAGEGRTGCVLAAYMIRTRKVGAEQALATLRALKPEFVEWRQEDAVREFAAREGTGDRRGQE